MSYTLYFGHPDAEPYTDLDMEDLRRAFADEVRRCIGDLGSDGYDPTNMLDLMGVKNYNSDNDVDGRLWQAATDAEIERLTWRFVEDEFAHLFESRGVRMPSNTSSSWHIFAKEEDDA